MLPNTWLFTAPVMPEKQEKQWACTRIPNRREGVMSVVFSCSFFMTASKWGSENHFLHVLQMFSKIVFRHSITESKKLILDSVLIGTRKLGGTATTLLHFRHTTTQPHFTLMKWKKKKEKASSTHVPLFFFCKQNWSCHLEPPNTDHMWVQHWQSDYIVEQAVEFIRKKLARRSAGLSPIGQSRGLLRLRAPQTFLRIIFSIPLLSSVRTDQITAQGLHCEGLFKKSCFQCCLSFMLSLSLTS